MKSAIALAAALFFLGAAAVSAATVSVPNFPSTSQLEAGWTAAFAALLTSEYGTAPTITATTTYQGADGYIYVVSRYTAGTVVGSIVGIAFDPSAAISIGDGAYEVKAEDGFRCFRSEGSCPCSAEQMKTVEGDLIRRCLCDGKTGACGFQDLDGSFSGSYSIRPSDYASLPAMQ